MVSLLSIGNSMLSSSCPLGKRVQYCRILTLESLSLGDSDAVDHLVGGEHVLDLDLLLEVLAGEVDLQYLN